MCWPQASLASPIYLPNLSKGHARVEVGAVEAHNRFTRRISTEKKVSVGVLATHIARHIRVPNVHNIGLVGSLSL